MTCYEQRAQCPRCNAEPLITIERHNAFTDMEWWVCTVTCQQCYGSVTVTGPDEDGTIDSTIHEWNKWCGETE